MRRKQKSAFNGTNPMMVWWNLAARSAEMLTASAEVVARRSVQMSRMGHSPSARDRSELVGMVTEKVAATQQSATAMFFTASSTAAHAWLTPWWLYNGRGSRKSAAAVTDSAAEILTAGMQPYRQRAISNAKRLRKRKTT
ncbi:hypothetical protein ACN9MB_10555 [Dyella kyungheensis]|uniref:hypothetical protein n=1 Tax=Dyella kyungheensis TaxID=1242174 RepID=UPI003CF39815